MQPDPRELVDRLDALREASRVTSPEPWKDKGPAHMEIVDALDSGVAEIPRSERAYVLALVNAYPALRAAVLRCVEMEAVKVWCTDCAAPHPIGDMIVMPWGDAATTQEFFCKECAAARAALTAPQGEEQGT